MCVRLIQLALTSFEATFQLLCNCAGRRQVIEELDKKCLQSHYINLNAFLRYLMLILHIVAVLSRCDSLCVSHKTAGHQKVFS